MDKYEFNIKVEQLKKAIKNDDYLTAMKLADTIDWRRVSSVSLLTTVSEVYERNRDYTEAKEILLLAYEKAPIGKRLLYKLTLLALNEGNIPEAEAYYREFYDLAPDDPRQHILRYMILKAKGAPNEQLINTLEQYNKEELDEHWMYELAELYHRGGRGDECVQMCDKIMLMFGIGNYVDKAIDLKLNQEGRALTPYQQSLIDNRAEYESQLRAVQERSSTFDEPESILDGPTFGIEDNQEDPSIILDKPFEEEISSEVTIEEEKPEAVEAAVAAPAVEIAVETPVAEPESELEALLKPLAVEIPDPEISEQVQEVADKSEKEEPEMTIYTVNFIVERRTEEDGVAAAVRLLKLMHDHTGSLNKVAKIPAEKLNKLGVANSKDKLVTKDLVVEQAGDLSAQSVQEIIDLIKEEPDGRVVVLIDNPMQIRNMLGKYPELTTLFHIDKETETAQPKKEAPKKAEPVKEVEEEAPAREYEEVREEAPARKAVEEMDIDAFADYAQEYAESIDCSISGKSKLALYERIELMEEDGIPLTKDNAVALIEEAADLAEKKKLSGLFKPKYDKDDKLILREEHFIQ